MSVSDNLNLINQMAEDEEFSESEVVFSDHHDNNHNHNLPIAEVEDDDAEESKDSEEEKKDSVEEKKRAARVSSMPVNIPQAKVQRWDSDESEEMEPPHVIVGRRVAGKMAFSVYSGNGRTLKGRDLRRVRNSILRLTGFIEA